MIDLDGFGFQGHLSSEFPSQIVVDVTEHCCLACLHCPHEAFRRSRVFGGRHLPFDIHTKLIDEVAQKGKRHLKYLRYTAQGEPLMHPRLVEMVAYAAGKSGIPINLTTNGVLLCERSALDLLDAGVNLFDISIDAHTDGTYSKIRRRGDLRVTRSNVLRLIEFIQKRAYEAKVVVSFVMQSLNIHEREEFQAFWSNRGADEVVFRRLHSCAGSNEAIARAMRLEQGTRKPCLYPWERLVLSPNGKIGYCPADWEYAAKIVSLHESTLEEIWQSEFMEKLRQAHIDGNLADYPLCADCPDWRTVRWPNEGLSYSNMMQELVPAGSIDRKP